MGNPNRVAKTSLSNFDSASGAGSYGFDSLSILRFDTGFTSPSSGALAKNTVQTRLYLPQRLAIVKVSFGLSAFTAPTGASPTSTFNLVVGEGTTYTNSAAAQTVSVAGNQVFNSNQDFSTISAPGALMFYPDVPEAWYDMNQELTLRIVLSGGTTNGSVTTVQVSLTVALIDAHPGIRTANPSTDF